MSSDEENIVIQVQAESDLKYYQMQPVSNQSLQSRTDLNNNEDQSVKGLNIFNEKSNLLSLNNLFQKPKQKQIQTFKNRIFELPNRVFIQKDQKINLELIQQNKNSDINIIDDNNKTKDFFRQNIETETTQQSLRQKVQKEQEAIRNINTARVPDKFETEIQKFYEVQQFSRVKTQNQPQNRFIQSNNLDSRPSQPSRNVMSQKDFQNQTIRLFSETDSLLRNSLITFSDQQASLFSIKNDEKSDKKTNKLSKSTQFHNNLQTVDQTYKQMNICENGMKKQKIKKGDTRYLLNQTQNYENTFDIEFKKQSQIYQIGQNCKNQRKETIVDFLEKQREKNFKLQQFQQKYKLSNQSKQSEYKSEIISPIQSQVFSNQNFQSSQQNLTSKPKSNHERRQNLVQQLDFLNSSSNNELMKNYLFDHKQKVQRVEQDKINLESIECLQNTKNYFFQQIAMRRQFRPQIYADQKSIMLNTQNSIQSDFFDLQNISNKSPTLRSPTFRMESKFKEKSTILCNSIQRQTLQQTGVSIDKISTSEKDSYQFGAFLKIVLKELEYQNARACRPVSPILVAEDQNQVKQIVKDSPKQIQKYQLKKQIPEPYFGDKSLREKVIQQIQILKNKTQFQEYFKNHKNLHSFSILDSNIFKELESVDPQLKFYLNQLFVEGENPADLKNNISEHVDKQLDSLQKIVDNSRIIRLVDDLKGKALWKKIVEKKVLNIIRKNNQIQQIQRNEQMDIAYIIQVKVFQDLLENIFENGTFGEAITNDPNLYHNSDPAFQALLRPSYKFSFQYGNILERVAKREEFSQIFNQLMQKRLFYSLAKEGKLNKKQFNLTNNFDLQKQIEHEIEQLQKLQANKDKVLSGDQKFQNKKLESAIIQKIILDFYKSLNVNDSVPEPLFAQPLISENILSLRMEKVSKGASQALAKFLEGTKYINQCKIKQIVIDECAMSDENFSIILKGAQKQDECLQSIIYQGNYLDDLSLEQIKILMPHLLEFSLSNPLNSYFKLQILKDLSTSFLEQGKNLKKIKLSKLRINDMEVVQNICEFIMSQTNLQELDLSWCCLQPKHLEMLSYSLIVNKIKLRKLNFSYNVLSFGDVQTLDQKSSMNFIINLDQFLKSDTIINHIDLSGMNLNGEPLIYLANQLSKTTFLSVIHLNDNGIMLETEKFRNELLDIFGVEIHNNILQVNKIFSTNPILQNQELIKNQVANFLKEGQKVCQDSYNTFTQENNQKKLQIKNQLIKTLQNKKVKYHQTMNSREGCGRGPTVNKENYLDHCTLSRRVNMPELIFNLNLFKDGYFHVDAAQNWVFSQNQECFVCDRHCLTVIMYEQNLNQQANSDLIQISDPEFVNQVKEHCLLQYCPPSLADAPLILGSVLHINGSNQFNIFPYSRKLKMLRAEFFSLLACSHAASFVQKHKIPQKIKQSVLAFTHKRQIIEQEVLIQLLKGWEHNLINYTLENQVHDVFTVNQPHWLIQKFKEQKGLLNISQTKTNDQQTEKTSESESSDSDEDSKSGGGEKPEPNIAEKPEPGKLFCFASYLPPGYHHFLIYDHAHERVFIKDIIVPISFYQQIYPEVLNSNEQTTSKPPRVNIWRPWIIDTQETEEIVYTNDLTSGLYEPELVVKSNEILEQIKQFQKTNRYIYKITYRELMARSSNYPRINFDEIYRILKIFMTPQEEEILPRAFIELSFIKSLRNQNKNLLKGTVCRAEFMDFLLRISIKLESKNIYQGQVNFINRFLKPIALQSEIPLHRQQIRASLKLNDLLHKNKPFLEKLYNKKKQFTKEDAFELICQDLTQNINDNTSQPLDLNLQLWDPLQTLPTYYPPDDPLESLLPQEPVFRCFSYCLMTVQNEQIQSDKYFYCEYVEFLEFICRVAINLYSDVPYRSVYKKTKDLLEILLKRENFKNEQLQKTNKGQNKSKILAKKATRRISLLQQEIEVNQIEIPSEESEND